MPLRSDPSLWWNIPGVVAAYQPVACPGGPLAARYNMANGGQDRYRVAIGSGTFSAVAGFMFSGAQRMSTSIVPLDQSWSMFAAFSGGAAGYNGICGSWENSPTSKRFALWNSFEGSAAYNNAVAETKFGAAFFAGTMGFAGRNCYRNGVYVGTMASVALAVTLPIQLGAPQGWTTTIALRAVAIYNRTISAAEAWTASRQMAYCHVNPDWSVWSPRRKWFPYVLAGAGFQAAWAERANRLIGGG